ncbi:helix-turn-helix domain-containing protein [Microvirga massiliensis]|uniref:helix-turn-helix domain-containing protein n=1 Tax=Microvirga massiliensis TaxID=1033741 RepID=UPI00062BE76B|nr:helix-turn-helix transcriptional regulator [Microvirga massiliensis]
MGIQFEEIGQRLRAHRLGRGLTAGQIAETIGVSRAAVYRLEKGELVKIETLERLSELLDVSLPSLLGVGVEYYSNAVSFFERMRQLEEQSFHVLGNFSPISFLLLSEDYMGHLKRMLLEAAPEDHEQRGAAIEHIEAVLGILRERRASAARRKIPVVSVVGASDIERFLRIGLISRFDLSLQEVKERRRAARQEVERLADLVERQPIGVQIGVVEEAPPSQTFQVFERDQGTSVTLSPYRLGDQPNISAGIAMVTSASEAVRLFKETISRQWERAHKGQHAADILRSILARTPT